MIDPRIIQLLDSPDVEHRKKAVMALAKTKDSEALPYLAKVYKNDKNSEVRELARKGGIYIKKQLDEAAAVPVDSYDEGDYGYEEDDDYGSGGYDDDAYSSRLSYYDEAVEDDAPTTSSEDVVMPSEMVVSSADVSRAQNYVDQAMDWNVRGNNEKAAQLLQRALRINPRLMHDSYTLSLAATVTGVVGDEAMRILAPSPEELRKRYGKSGRGAASAGTSGLQQAMTLLVMMGAAVVLVGYFIMPWMDYSDVPNMGIDGEVISTEQALSQLGDVFGAFLSEEALERSISKIQLQVTGLDITLLVLQWSPFNEVIGINAFFRALGEEMGADDAQVNAMVQSGEDAVQDFETEPVPLDYLLLLAPISAVLAIVYCIFLLRSASISKWIICIFIGLMGIASLLYFYTSAAKSAIPDDFTSEIPVVITDATEFIAVGYWIALGGILAVVILPFIAMLLMPPAEQED